MSKKNAQAAKSSVATVTSSAVPGVFNSDVKALAEGKDFPFSIYVTNNTNQPIVEAELNAVVPPYQTVEVTVRDADKLQRAASNFEQLCFINNWTDGISLSDKAPEPTAEEAVPQAQGQEPV